MSNICSEMNKPYNEAFSECGYGLCYYCKFCTRNTKIISAFPGTGKSFIFNNNNTTLLVLDSDSSKFSWIEKGVRHPDFPNNYIEHIKNQIGKVDLIFVSSHDVVRNALKNNNLNYTLVYPDESCKKEYLERFKQRGNDKSFINMMNNNWHEFISQIEEEAFPVKIKLQSKQYLKDVL